MNNRTKTVGLWISGFLALGLVCLCLVYLYLTPERIQALLVSRLSQSLGRPVSIDRVAKNGFEVSAFEILVSDRPEFGRVPFLALDRAVLDLSPGVIWAGGADLTLTRPRVSILSNEKGESNYADVMDGHGVAIPLRRLEVVEGRIQAIDLSKDLIRVAESVEYEAELGIGRSHISVEGELSVSELVEQKSGQETIRLEKLEIAHSLVISMGSDELRTEAGQIRSSAGQAAVNVERVQDGESAFRNVHLLARVGEGVLRVDSIRAVAFGGLLTGQVIADARSLTEVLPFEVTARMTDVFAEEVIRGYLKQELPLYGRIQASFNGKGELGDSLRLEEATGLLQMDEGRLVNWKWLQEATAGIPSLASVDYRELHIRNLELPFQLNENGFQLEDAKFRADNMECRVNGETSRDGKLNYIVSVAVPAANLGGFLGGLLGGTTIPLQIQITGTTGRPRVGLGLIQAPRR